MLKFLKFCLAFLLLFQVSVAGNDCDDLYSEFSKIYNNPNLKEFADAFDADVELIIYWDKLYDAGKRGEALTNPNVSKFLKLSELEGFGEVRSKVLAFDNSSISKFSDDFIEYKVKVRILNENLRLVDAWKVGDKVGIEQFYRRDINKLREVSKYLDDSNLSVNELVDRIPKNKDFSKNWFNYVGKFGKQTGKKGDYVVEEAGEVFYRAIPKDHYEELLKDKKLLKPAEWKSKDLEKIGGEGSTSPKLGFSSDYRGVLVKYYVKKGTIDKLAQIGVVNAEHPLIKRYYGEMLTSEQYTTLTGKKWGFERVQFKFESNPRNPGQVNIQLGKGDGLDIFNENLITIEKLGERQR